MTHPTLKQINKFIPFFTLNDMKVLSNEEVKNGAAKTGLWSEIYVYLIKIMTLIKTADVHYPGASAFIHPPPIEANWLFKRPYQLSEIPYCTKRALRQNIASGLINLTSLNKF